MHSGGTFGPCTISTGLAATKASSNAAELLRNAASALATAACLGLPLHTKLSDSTLPSVSSTPGIATARLTNIGM